MFSCFAGRLVRLSAVLSEWSGKRFYGSACRLFAVVIIFIKAIPPLLVSFHTETGKRKTSMRIKNHTVIITVAIIKGGSGKTTTSMALAELLHKRGEQVTVLDSDNTGGATMWEMYVEQENRRRRQDNPDAEPYTLGFPVVQTNEAILNNPEHIREKYSGWVIIDTPPSDAGVVQAAINAGDVVIIPCQPSVSDLTHAGRTYAAARNGIVLLTRVKPRTKLARNSISELDEEGIARFETVITEREAVKNMYGTTEIDNKEYSSVVQELIDYLSEINLVEE